MVQPRSTSPTPGQRLPKLPAWWKVFTIWADAIAIAVWGLLLLKLWLTNKLPLLIHPAYTGLCVACGVVMLVIGIWKCVQLWQRPKTARLASGHINLLPQGSGAIVLLFVAMLGLVISPKPFDSQVALDRGLNLTATTGRAEPESFRGNSKPEDRTIVDWGRTLGVYPEPDAYRGQAVNVDGFVVHPAGYPDNYLMVARFVLTCCAADAYPVALPVRLPAGKTKADYKADAWLRVQGAMDTAELAGERKLTIVATALTPIPEPKNPYEY